jgi:hypothetical protein
MSTNDYCKFKANKVRFKAITLVKKKKKKEYCLWNVAPLFWQDFTNVSGKGVASIVRVGRGKNLILGEFGIFHQTTWHHITAL